MTLASRRARCTTLFLVGSSTRIPKVQQLLTDYFNRKEQKKGSIFRTRAVMKPKAPTTDDLLGMQGDDTWIHDSRAARHRRPPLGPDYHPTPRPCYFGTAREWPGLMVRMATQSMLEKMEGQLAAGNLILRRARRRVDFPLHFWGEHICRKKGKPGSCGC